MGDIENELDSVLDRYQKKQVETRNRELIDQRGNEGTENEFKDSFNTIVRPSMTEMARYLEARGNEFKGSYVKFSPHLAKISLIINAYRLQQGSGWAEIEFSRHDDKLRIVTKNDRGMTSDALFDKSVLKPHFVKRMLIDFVKSYYST